MQRSNWKKQQSMNKKPLGLISIRAASGARPAPGWGMLPLVTLLGGLLPALVGGSVIVEWIFNIPGMGLLTLEAASAGDVPLAMGIITLIAVLTMIGYVLTDVLHGLLDPRFLRET